MVQRQPQDVEVAQALAGRGVTVTAITIGPRNSLMEEIARIGRGRYHVTNNAGSLPSLFVREAQFRQPPANRRGAIRPRVVTSLAMLDGVPFDSAPPLGGHALSTARPQATTVLGADRYPVLAHWHRGLGQVATFTSATSGEWADAWRTWSGFRDFWVSLSEGMLRTRPIEPPQLTLAPHPLIEGVQVLSVLAPTIESEPLPIVQIFQMDKSYGADGIAVSAEHAEEQGWTLGSPVAATFPGGSTTFVVEAIFSGSTDWVGTMFVDLDGLRAHGGENLDFRVYVSGDETAIEGVADNYGAAKVLDKAAFLGVVSAQVDTMLGLFYALLVGTMLAGALNYNNNPALLLALLLAAAAIASAIAAHLQLSGVQIDAISAEPVPAGQPLRLRVDLSLRDPRARHGLHLQLGDSQAWTSLALGPPTGAPGFGGLGKKGFRGG